MGIKHEHKKARFVRRDAAPELIMPGNWHVTVAQGEAHCSLKSKQMTIPSAKVDQATRVHEMLHVRYSERIPDPSLTEVERYVAQCFEDARVHMLGLEQGVQEPLELLERAKQLPTDGKIDRILKGIYGAPLLLHDPDTYKAYLKECGMGWMHPLESRDVAQLTTCLLEGRHDPAISAELAKEVVRMYGLEDVSSCSGFKIPLPHDPTTPITPIDPEVGDDIAHALEDSGTMEIIPMVELTQPVPKISKRTDTGFTLKYPQRIYTDGMCFTKRRKRPLVGTVLIDCSGSMSINHDELQRIVELSGGATIAGYCARGGHVNNGQLYILAHNGKVVDELPYLGGGNVVDLPALLWMVEQSGPYVWVCDGVVTGKGDHTKRNITNACFHLRDEYRVTRMKTLYELKRWLEERHKKQRM